MTGYTIRTASAFTHAVREIECGRKTNEDRTVTTLALAIVIAAKTGMVKERSIDIRKTGICDLRRGSGESRDVIPGRILVMTV
jgi:5-carboxymethyl-2-hydroxymuconate isomerase